METQNTICKEFGKTGQADKGVDLVATHDDGSIDVGQCKAVEKLTVAIIKEASSEFLQHWEYWKDKRVKRFILLVGSDVVRRELTDEQFKQERQFADYGLKYELWPASTIVNKIRPHRGIVKHHLGSMCAEEICGPIESYSLQFAGQLALNQQLALTVSTFTDKRLIEIKDAWNH